jgi:hypothetical protein
MTDDPRQFALVPLPQPGHPAYDYVSTEALATGGEELVTEFLGRVIAEERLAQTAKEQEIVAQQQEENRGAIAKALTGEITLLDTRRDTFEKQLALSEKRKVADRKRRDERRVQRMQDKEQRNANALNPIAHPDEGELEVKRKVTPPPGEDPDYGEEDDAEGDLPTELMKDVPATPGTSPIAGRPTPLKEISPPSTSLN